MKVKNGIDNITKLNELLKGNRLALITGGSAINENYVSTLDYINENYNLVKLFNTIYGVRTEYIFGEKTLSYVDEITGLTAQSIFHKDFNAPTKEMLADIDMVVFDIREAGCRYFEYLYCLANAMKACASAKKTFVVLDRVAPINGVDVEGVICPKDMHTMVGDYNLPNRIGMTVGEFASYVNEEFNINCDLHIVPLIGWNRNMYYDETGIPWVLPSPNLPNTNANILYAGMCILEGIGNINEGRGTSKPFELIGAPWIDGNKLAKMMNESELAGVGFSSSYYIPVSSKYMKERCSGVQIHITNRSEFKPVLTALKLVENIMQMYPDTLQWKTTKGTGHDVKECSSTINFEYYFDKLLGTSDFREGKYSAEDLINSHQLQIEKYKNTKMKYHLYGE